MKNFMVLTVMLLSVTSVIAENPLEYYSAPFGCSQLEGGKDVTHWLMCSEATLNGINSRKREHNYDKYGLPSGMTQSYWESKDNTWKAEEPQIYSFNSDLWPTYFNYTKYEYDEYGRVIKSSVKYSSDQDAYVTEYVYDPEGRVLSHTAYNLSNDGRKRMLGKYTYTYSIVDGVTVWEQFIESADEDGGFKPVSKVTSRNYQDSEKRWGESITEYYRDSKWVTSEYSKWEDVNVLPGKDNFYVRVNGVTKTEIDGVLTVTHEGKDYKITQEGDSKWVVNNTYYAENRETNKFVYFNQESTYERFVFHENGHNWDILRQTKMVIKESDTLDGEDWKPYRIREDFYDGRLSLGYDDKNYVNPGESVCVKDENDEFGRRVKREEFYYDKDWNLIPRQKYTAQYYGSGSTKTAYDVVKYNRNTGEWMPYISYEWEYDYDVPVDRVQTYNAINMTTSFATNEYLMKSEKRTTSNGVELTIHNYGQLSPENGVDETLFDENSSEAEFYSLSGIKIDARDLAPGIYVKVQGAKRTKIIVK